MEINAAKEAIRSGCWVTHPAAEGKIFKDIEEMDLLDQFGTSGFTLSTKIEIKNTPYFTEREINILKD